MKKALIVIAALVCCVPLFAAVDAFMKIDGIKGESSDPRHKDWIEISRFSWGQAAPNSTVANCATGEMMVTVSPAAAQALLPYCNSHRALPQITLEASGQNHVLLGAVIRSCQNNLFTIHFDRCTLHPAVALRAGIVTPPDTPAALRGGIVTPSDTPLAIGGDATETIVSLRSQGPNDVVVVQRGSSPAFFKNCVAGAHYKKVVINMRKAGGSQQEFLKITMTDVTVSSLARNPDGSATIGLRYATSDPPVSSVQR